MATVVDMIKAFLENINNKISFCLVGRCRYISSTSGCSMDLGATLSYTRRTKNSILVHYSMSNYMLSSLAMTKKL